MYHNGNMRKNDAVFVHISTLGQTLIPATIVDRHNQKMVVAFSHNDALHAIGFTYGPTRQIKRKIKGVTYTVYSDEETPQTLWDNERLARLRLDNAQLFERLNDNGMDSAIRLNLALKKLTKTP